MISDQRVKGVTHGHWQALSMADDAERQRDDNVWNPAVKPPVKKRLKDSLLRFLIVVRDWDFLHVTR